MPHPRATRQASFSGKSPPRKPKNVDVRPREYLIEDEAQQLMQAARRTGRHGHRDATLILITYRHALRAAEAIALQWHLIDLGHGRLHVRRRKQGVASVHPLRGPEIRALRRLKRESHASPYVFITERGGPLSDSAMRKIVARAGRVADLSFPVHPHMLRHAAGYKLANDGHACACHPALSWSQKHSTHDPLHAALVDPLPRLLAGLATGELAAAKKQKSFRAIKNALAPSAVF